MDAVAEVSPDPVRGPAWGILGPQNGSYWNPWWPHFGVIFNGPTCRDFTGPSPPVRVVGGPLGEHCARFAGPRTFRYQIIYTLGLVQGPFLDLFHNTLSNKCDCEGPGGCSWLPDSLLGSRLSSSVPILGIGKAKDPQIPNCRNFWARLGSLFWLSLCHFFSSFSAQNLVCLWGHMWAPSLPSHALSKCRIAQ
jgi:hypothetical protein